RDLRQDVNAGAFRLDLYHRIAVVVLDLPPLRERPTDIPLLIAHFLSESGRGASIGSVFDAATLDQMERYPWPGNVRELRNVVESARALGTPPVLAGALPAEVRPSDPLAAALG